MRYYFNNFKSDSDMNNYCPINFDLIFIINITNLKCFHFMNLMHTNFIDFNK